MRSQTAFGLQREIIHHGVVFEVYEAIYSYYNTYCNSVSEQIFVLAPQQHGEPRHMVLFNDFLMVLQRREKHAAADLTSFEWFSDNTYIARKVAMDCVRK